MHSNISKWQQLGWFTLHMMLGAVFVITLIAVAPQVETKHMPVVKDFEITTVERHGAVVVARGTMEKVRDCRFVEMLAYATHPGETHASPIRVDFSPAQDELQTRLPIPQTWGPWALLLHMPQPAKIQLAVRHECHGVYYTTTHLTEFEVP